jgi:hypothetical protein
MKPAVTSVRCAQFVKVTLVDFMTVLPGLIAARELVLKKKRLLFPSLNSWFAIGGIRH